ncbi:MAG: extracellular solute-binding protein [Candidatus Paceibacteria bacterium]
MSIFRIGIIAVFVVFAVIGVLAFSGVGGIGGDDNNIGEVEIWGTIPEGLMKAMFNDINIEIDNFAGVRYVEKDPNTYNAEFVEALASGRGPDLFLLPHDSIVRHSDKLIELPYKSFSEREFKSTFIEEGEMYLTETGILGLPFTIDPLVMYWNRDIFQNAGVANPPEFWDELFVLSPKITQRDLASNITRSFTALGEFRNVENAKEILSALIIQSGNPIIASSGGELRSVIRENIGFSTSPAESAVRFYTEFSNPVKSVYSWNRSLQNSKQLFAAGDLAIYFGFASELTDIIRANPNLNFDVSLLPQLRDSNKRVTYGKMSAFAVPRASANPTGAFITGIMLTDAVNVFAFSQAIGLPPVRRDLLSNRPTDAFSSVFYDSALISNAWLEPDSAGADDIFQNMIESVTSGRARLSEAINIADEELNLLLNSR